MNRFDNNPLFIITSICTIISYIFSSLAFIVSKWYGRYPGSVSTFENIGLWEICFNSFMHEDIYDQLFSDCFYINGPELQELYSWIVKSWLLASQIIFTLSFIGLMFASILCLLMGLGLLDFRKRKNAIILTILHIISSFTCLITLILFGVNTKNLSENDWMPYPSQCSLSWSYGSAALSLLASMICLGFIFHALRSKSSTYISWTCNKKFDIAYEEAPLPIAQATSHQNVHVSIYDPRGDSSASKISTPHRDRSVISSKLAPVEKKIPRKENNPETSTISQKPRPHLEKSSKKEHNPEPSIISQNSRSNVEKLSKMSSPPASQLTVTSRNVPSSAAVITAKPMRRK